MWQLNAYSYKHINFRGVIVNAKQFVFLTKVKHVQFLGGDVNMSLDQFLEAVFLSAFFC